MNTADFDFLSRLIKERSGLVLTPDKLYLLESRLTPVARKHGIEGLLDLVAGLRTRTDDTVLNDVVEAMTTNESFFFRDSHMFDTFRDEALPALIAARQSTKRLRIWCAAASSGQEPYSIAMILKQMEAQLAGWNIEILGTDLSLEILDRAKSGIYTQFEVQRGVPTNFLLTYFERVEEQWQIVEPIRKMVQYRPYNLLDNLTLLGKFDVVFCRNVLIYFDDPTKGRILDTIATMMPPDGVLLLGGAESVLGLSKAFESSAGQRGFYRLTGAQTATPGAAATPAPTPTAAQPVPPAAPATQPAAAPPAAPAVKPVAAPLGAPAVQPAAAPPVAPTVKPAAPLTTPNVQPTPTPPATPAVAPIAPPATKSAAAPSVAPAKPAAALDGAGTTPTTTGLGGTGLRTPVG
jgi:chemotaxis protein methyltransferase CheR